MSIHNPSNLYSAGAVTLNSQPSVNFYAQLVQRKQAREEALDQYEMNRINRMNEQGVRDIDRPGLDAKVIDMKTYYNANKDKIRKGNTPEAYNYEKMFRETLAGVSKSKNATARAETFNKIRLERQKLGRNTPEEWFNDYQQHEDTPIWDEKFTELDLPKYMSQNKVKYDPKATLDVFKDIKRTPLSPRYEPIQGDPFSKNEFIDEVFDKDAKMAIAARASDLYDNNDGFAENVQTDFNNPVRRGELEKVFVQEYGTQPQSMSDYAAAKALEQLQPKLTGKPKTVVDWGARARQMQAWKQQNIRLNASLQGKGGNTVTLEDVITPDGSTDLTKLLQGINVNNLVTGKSFKSDKTLYNPKTKEITFHDIVDDKDYTVPASKFRQIINTINTAQDLKTYDQLIEGIDKAFEPPKASTQKNRPPLNAFIKNK